jgi:hypothetical protein
VWQDDDDPNDDGQASRRPAKECRKGKLRRKKIDNTYTPHAHDLAIRIQRLQVAGKVLSTTPLGLLVLSGAASSRHDGDISCLVCLEKSPLE